MRFIIYLVAILLMFSTCGRSGNKTNEVDISTKIKVNEVLQTANYTYIQASSKGKPENYPPARASVWPAVSS